MAIPLQNKPTRILYPLLGILLNPTIVGVAIAFSAVSVVSNALRFRHY